MDRFDQLTAFVRTVTRGSQTAAARELGVTPAMVGRYIRALEDRLGARLLNRTTTTQSLTEAGTLLFERAGAVLEELDAAEGAVAARQAAPTGTLRVSAPMAFGTLYLGAAMAAFGARYPGLRVEMTLNDRVVDLVEEGYDLALRIGRLADSTLVSRRLATCRMVVVAAPAYLKRRGMPATPDALRAHDCLLYSYAAAGRMWRFTGPAGRVVSVEVSGRMVANNGEALNAAALAGAGIVQQPTFIAGAALRAGSLLRVLPGWGIEDLALHAAYPSARHLAPKVRLAVDFLAARFRDPPVWDEGI